MLHINKPPYQKGHTLLEALIATSITALVSATIWQLTNTSKQLADSAYKLRPINCLAPTCSQTTHGVICVCGDIQTFIIR